MLAKAHSQHRFQRTVDAYQYKCRSRQPTPESRFGIPNHLRCVEKPTDLDRGVSVLRIAVVVRKLVSIHLRSFLCRVEVPEFAGADISLGILAKTSAFPIDS